MTHYIVWEYYNSTENGIGQQYQWIMHEYIGLEKIIADISSSRFHGQIIITKVLDLDIKDTISFKLTTEGKDRLG